VGYRIGIDVGGTFTDLVLAGPGGTLVLDKHPTTPRDQSDGVLGGLGQLAAREGLALEALLGKTDLIVHGTTTADNTMIEMSGATTGLVTSDGHRDEIEIGAASRRTSGTRRSRRPRPSARAGGATACPSAWTTRARSSSRSTRRRCGAPAGG
jgi:N-methylhydantoinase A